MYEIFEHLLQQKGLTAYRVGKDLGISHSIFSKWKSGVATPRSATMKMIADYLNVSVDYLMGGITMPKDDDDNEEYYLNEETSMIAKEIYYNKELKLLFDTAIKSDAEDLRLAHAMLSALKNKGK